MLTPLQLQAGFERNNKKLEQSLDNQLSFIYEMLVPTTNQLRFIVEFPKSAINYRMEYINIGIPSNAQLDNFFFVATNDSYGIKYVSENLRRNQLGAKISLWTTPGADKDPTAAGDQTSYSGMMPLGINFKGQSNATFYFRGNGLSALPYVKVLISGHQQNRISGGGGYNAKV